MTLSSTEFETDNKRQLGQFVQALTETRSGKIRKAPPPEQLMELKTTAHLLEYPNRKQHSSSSCNTRIMAKN